MVQSESSQETPQRRIARPVPLRESVYEAILDMIVTGGLRPGQHLVENELAVQLGVSRQPVREALQWLKNDGWVQLRPGHGAFVHAPTATEADQLLAVRTVLETESARLAASNATDTGVQRLRELCRRGVAALADDDIDAVVAANAEFHTTVTQLSGNEVLVELAAQVDRRVRWYFTPVARHRGPQSWEEHAALIEAIVAGDGDGAAKVMREHTEHTRESYLEQRAEEPEEADAAPRRRAR
jgi:DNA-binding GntR family transcriptional regulator